MKRYRDLTKAQTRVLASIAFGEFPCAVQRTLEILEGKGLIVVASEEQRRDALGPYTFKTYEMPIAEHIAFCEWCAAQAEEEPR